MNHLVVAAIVFVCVFGSALIGLSVRSRLPAHHFSDESIGVVKLATGLIATIAALVLGLLVSSAKTSFDTVSAELTQNAASIIRLDRVLAKYGPETHELRASLKHIYSNSIDILETGDVVQLAKIGSPQAVSRTEEFQRQIEALAPRNDAQRGEKARALDIVESVFAARWLTLLQSKGSIPVALLAILVAWLSIIFGAFGLYAPRNGTVVIALLLCALSAAGAILIIQEMATPLDGLVRVPLGPMREALSRLGQ
ncbi:hypothetical protein [Caballeronia sp. RCC_10]|uniref:bestrophin-like domain n=1 Tax=Caballeronia sp. RCC_10 TaxID=3239227 RepID=UPI00352637E7